MLLIYNELQPTVEKFYCSEGLLNIYPWLILVVNVLKELFDSKFEERVNLGKHFFKVLNWVVSFYWDMVVLTKLFVKEFKIKMNFSNLVLW